MRLNKLIWIQKNQGFLVPTKRFAFLMVFVFLVMISFSYALEPGKLWINGVFIPFTTVDCFKDKCADIAKIVDGEVTGIDLDKGIYGDGIVDSTDLLAFATYDGICKDDPSYYDKIDFNNDGCIRLTGEDNKCMLEWVKKGKTDCSLPELFDASISIATLKDSYNVNEKIELTDPPDEISFSEDKITGNVVNKNIDLQRNIIYETGLVVEEKLKKEFEEGIIPKTIDTSKLPKYVKGELIVKLKEDISSKITGSVIKTDISSIDELNKKYNVEKIENVFKVKKEGFFESIGNTAKELVGIDVPKRELKKVYKLEIPEEVDVEKAIEEYSEDLKVEYAEPNYIYYTSFVPNDERYSEQWAHQNTQAELGWDITKGSSDVVIAIVDTGVDYTHEDLAANIWQNSDEIPDNGIDDDNNGYIDDIRGYDFVDTDYVSYCAEHPDEYETLDGEDYNTTDNDPMDFNGHGTHCAGISAAVGNNGIGVSGVCPNCKIMPVRAGFSIKINDWGTWYEVGSLEDDDIANSIHYAADNNAKIISMSFGGMESDVIKEAIDYAYNKGVVLIAAAGNDQMDLRNYPAAFDNVIAVAAIDIDNDKASFSNYGNWIDVAAPGVNILSTVPPYTTYNSELKINGITIQSNALEGSATTLNEISGELVNVNLGKEEDLSGKTLTGKIALIQRGDISFKDKVNNVKNAGAIGAIIYNNEDKNFRGNLQEQVSIPAVSISKEDGESLINQINVGIVTANLKVWTEISKYDFYSGTSMACPYVAGLAGLILSKQKYEPEEVRQILRNGVDNVDSDLYIGTGRVNIKRSLEFEPIAIAKIISPKNSEVIFHRIEIKGTATGDSYTVYYGEGIYPKEWIEIGSGTNVNDGVLANLNIFNLDSDVYTLKLEIQKSNVVIRDTIQVKFLSGLKEGWPQQTSKEIYSSPILGDINNDGMKEVIVSSEDGKIYVWKYDGSLVFSKEISPVYYNGNDGRYIAFIFPGTPDLADMNGDGFLDIITGSYDGKVHVINHEGNYLTNWPRVVYNSIDNDSIYSSPSIGDLDKDNDLEIVIMIEGSLYVLDSDGNVLEGWPKFISPALLGPQTPALGDLDNNGDLEIVLGSYDSGLHIYNHDGSYYLSEDYRKSEEYITLNDNMEALTTIALGDINNDGNLEILVKEEANLYMEKFGKIHAFDNTGRIIWTKDVGVFMGSAPALGDINKDNFLEIIFGNGGETELGTGDTNNVIYVLDYKGDVIDGWPKVTVEGESGPRAWVWSAPTLGDVDGDSFVDILSVLESGGIGVIGMEPEGSRIYALTHDAEVINGWPKMIPPSKASASIGDIDNDGYVDIAVTSSDGRVYIFNPQQSYNPSTMEWPMFQHDPQHTGNYHFKERPQSKIVNNEDFDLNGYLTINIQKENNGVWQDYGERSKRRTIRGTIITKEVTIPANGLLKLDQIYNPIGFIPTEIGKYRVVAEFKDENENIIKTKSGELRAEWEFEVTK